MTVDELGIENNDILVATTVTDQSKVAGMIKTSKTLVVSPKTKNKNIHRCSSHQRSPWAGILEDADSEEKEALGKVGCSI